LLYGSAHLRIPFRSLSGAPTPFTGPRIWPVSDAGAFLPI